MDATALRALQAPLKQRYREQPDTALIPAHAEASLDPGRLAAVLTPDASRVAGLHRAAGGRGGFACSADMLLEALAACAGVTLTAVATAMGADLRGGRVIADGMWDARGTLGIDKTVPVGMQEITLTFELEGDIDEAAKQRLVQMTERYCVILATLREPPTLKIAIRD